MTAGAVRVSAWFSVGLAGCAFAVLLSGPARAQDPQPPTDPVLKNPIPDQPPRNKEVETPPPAPGITPGALPASLTLDQAISFALRLQPTVANAVANREAAAERRLATQSRYYPTVTPVYQFVDQYSFGRVNQFVGGSVGVITVSQGRTSTTKQAQIGASVNLFDSGERELSARQARQSLRAAEYNETNARQTVIGNVADAYFSVLRTEALVRVSQAQVTRAQNTLDVVTAQAEAGVTARKDIFQAQADFLNAQVNLLQAQNNAAIAQATLKQSIGVVGGEPLRLAEVILPDVNTPISAVPAPPQSPAANQTTPARPPGEGVRAGEDAQLIDQLSATAYRTRPDIAANRQNVEVQRTSASLARVETGVQVAASATAADQFDADRFNSSIGNNRQFNLSLSYPLFDGGFVRSNFRASQATARAAEAQLLNLRQQVTVEVEQAYRTLAQNRASLPASAAAVQAARINYEAAILSRKEGVGSIVDVITAQTALVQAETNYVQAIYNFYAADARLARAVGQAEKISRIGQTAPANTPPIQFTDVPSADADAPATP
ncbi:MAG: TolC family protein [Capsulimonadales bacterium]|nr:TolC family protein [Capsulimonadales bacterium]